MSEEAGDGAVVEQTAEEKMAALKLSAEIDEAVTAIQRDVNCLSDGSKMTRKRSLKKLVGVLVDDTPEPQIMYALWAVIAKPLLKLYEDPVEKIREMAVDFSIEVMAVVPNAYQCLPYMLPVIVSRMGQPEIEEESEEVRLLFVKLLHVIVKACPRELALFMDDYIQILQRTVVDAFADVMKLSTQVIIDLAFTCQQRFNTGSKPLHKPLVSGLMHQHSRVRVAALQAITSVCLYGENTAINDFMVPLAQKSMDHAPTVRKALYTAVGVWMLELKDRYSFWHKLLTLMLNGVNDEIPEIGAMCVQKFHLAGRQYEKENEDDFKDMLDFGNTDPSRPPLGCRILVEREISKILPGLLKDICDWTVGVRLQSAKLLLTLLEYAEGKATMHLEKLLAGYFKAVRDEEQEISDLAVQCVEVTGMYTDPANWKSHVLPRLTSRGVSIGEQIAQLIVVGGLIRGSLKKWPVDEHLVDIARALAHEDVCAVASPEALDELLLLVGDIIEAAASTDMTPELSELLFTAMLHARAASSHIEEEFHSTLVALADSQSMDTVELYRTHTPLLLTLLKSTHNDWTKHSHHRQLFDTLLLRAGPVLGTECETVMEIFYCNFDVDKDPEVRLSFFALLSKLLSSADATLNSGANFAHAEKIITSIVIPNCIWLNGRVPAAIRTAATTCLWALLQSGLVKDADLKGSIAAMLPPLVSCLDDEYEETRGVVCKVLEQLLTVYSDGFTEDYAAYDRLHSLYPELLKRLDDNSDAIRLSVLAAWVAYGKCLASKSYDTQLYRAHLEVMFKGLLIHLDDPDASIQAAVDTVLRTMAPLGPGELYELASAAKGKHRDPAKVIAIEELAEGLM